MKKIICLFLTLVMLLSAFVSCAPVNDNSGDDSDVTSDNVASEPSDSESESEPETEPEEEPIVMKDYDLASFKIVYGGAHNLDVAESLKTKIAEKTGVELEIIAGDTANEGNELIIGKADRDISAACFDYKNNKYMDSYGILCDNGKVQLLGVDKRTIRDSIDYIVEDILAQDSATVSMAEKGALCEKINLKNEGITLKADSSQIRVITNNILQEYIAKNTYKLPETKSRISELIAAYALLDADVFGFQEVDEGWYTTCGLDVELAKLGYSLVPTNKEHISDTSNLNPIYYKTDRFDLLDSGHVAYNTKMFADGPYSERWFSWAVLEEKETGKQLIFLTTHLIWDNDLERGERYRQESARQMLAFVESMKATYPEAAAVVTGDFNSRLDSQPYLIMKEGMSCARETAETTVNMKYNSDMPKVGQKPSRGNPPAIIDHVFYTSDSLTAKRYEVSVSGYTYAYSDHVPVIVDFAFN